MALMGKATLLSLFCGLVSAASSYYQIPGVQPAPSNLRVVTVVDPEYANFANGAWSGFIPDLLSQVCSLANLTYVLSAQPDGVYGSRQADGSWSGMVGQLIANKQDVIAADFSITAAREMVLDYSTPFLTSQLRVVVKKGDDLSNVKFLVASGTSNQDLLKNSADPKLQKVWANIVANNGFISGLDDGAAKVQQGGFAFITASRSVVANSNGTLQFTKDVILTDFFALGVQQGSPLRESLSVAIAQLNEKGVLQQLISKYQLSIEREGITVLDVALIK